MIIYISIVLLFNLNIELNVIILMKMVSQIIYVHFRIKVNIINYRAVILRTSHANVRIVSYILCNDGYTNY